MVTAVLAASGIAAAGTGVNGSTPDPLTSIRLLHQTNRKIIRYRQDAWRWQALMGLHRTVSSYHPELVHSPAYAGWILRLWKGRAHRLHLRAKHWMSQRVLVFRATTNHWLRVLDRNPVRELSDVGSVEAEFNWWRRRENTLMNRIRRSLDIPAWTCIHGGEGAWNAVSNTTPTYYGGLQMDWGFMRKYGNYLLETKGTADHWTPLEQMVVAQKAHDDGRGFYPWPNTAHTCGLI